MVYCKDQQTNPGWHRGVVPKDVLDSLVWYCKALLVNQFASFLNVLTFSFVVGAKPIAALSVEWCTYSRYVFL